MAFVVGLGAGYRSATDPFETRRETPSDDSEATIVMAKPGRLAWAKGQADSPTVVLSSSPNLEATSRSLVVDPGHPDPAGNVPRSKRVDWLRTHWLSTLALVVVTGVMTLMVWLWARRNGGGVIPGQIGSPEQAYRHPEPVLPSQGSESNISAIRDELAPPGQEPGRHTEVSVPPRMVTSPRATPGNTHPGATNRQSARWLRLHPTASRKAGGGRLCNQGLRRRSSRSQATGCRIGCYRSCHDRHQQCSGGTAPSVPPTGTSRPLFHRTAAIHPSQPPRRPLHHRR